METTDNASLIKMMAKAKFMATKRKALERLDRCCHGGVVSYRLPLTFRLDCANGRYNA